MEPPTEEKTMKATAYCWLLLEIRVSCLLWQIANGRNG